MTGKSVKKKKVICLLPLCWKHLFICWGIYSPIGLCDSYVPLSPPSLTSHHRTLFHSLPFSASLSPFLPLLFALLLLCVCVCRGAVFLFLLFQWCTLSACFFSVWGYWRYSFSCCVLRLIFPISLYYNKICHNKSELPDSSNTKMRRTKEKQGSRERKREKRMKKTAKEALLHKPSKCKIQLKNNPYNCITNCKIAVCIILPL